MATLQSIDVSATTGAITLPTGTTAQRPVSPVTGQVRVNTSFSPALLEIYDGSGWKTFSQKHSPGPGLSSGNPAETIDDILNENPEAPDGLYWINVQGTARQIYCDMANGGWMLAMRFNGSSGTLQHDAGYWTDGNVLNSTSTPTSNQDIKTYAFFYTRPDNAFTTRWCLGFRHNFLEEYWYDEDGMQGVFRDTPAVQTNNDFGGVPRFTRHSRQKFEEWYNRAITNTVTGQSQYDRRAYQNGSGGTRWSNCNMRGINMRPNSGGQRLRYGTTLNNETQCSSNDYEWGMGMTGGRLGSYGCGQRGNWDGSYRISRYITGWCFVR